MAVRIRLTRVGATKRPSYRVIAIDKRQPRDGRALEILGYYDPLTEPATVHLETEKINAWIGKGAQPSETVVKLMRQAERAEQAAAAGAAAEKPKRATRPAKKPSKKADPKATATTEAPSEPEATGPAEEPQAAEAEQATAEPGEGEGTADGEKAEA